MPLLGIVALGFAICKSRAAIAANNLRSTRGESRSRRPPPNRRRAVKRAPIRAPILPSREKKGDRGGAERAAHEVSAPGAMRRRNYPTRTKPLFAFFLRPPLFDRTLGSPHRLAPSAACSLTFRRAGPPRKLWDGGPSDAGAVGQRRRPLRRARPRANLATKLAAQGRRPLRCPPNAVAFRPKRRKRGPFGAFGF